MKVAYRKQIENHVKRWAARLGISDYKFSFKYLSDRSMGGDYARIDTDEDTREVLIEFNTQRLTREPGEIEKTVVHELLHTRLNEYTEFAVDLIKESMENSKARRALIRKMEKLEHKVVVALSDALVKDTRKT